MKILNELIVSRMVFKIGDDDPREDKLYIAELTEHDEESDNIEIAIHDNKNHTYIKFRFQDLKRLVEK